MIHTLVLAALLCLPAATCLADGGSVTGGGDGTRDLRWGDLGDGTYANPVLNGDYSDPDVIRVGSKYYMTCSEFHFMGMPILESDDMVNWRIIGQVFGSIDLPGYSDMTKYGNGTWAPALRYHDGKYWIYVCTPNEGLFMTTADNPAGPWAPLHCVKAVSGWEDPCPLWDDDGQAYLGRSQLGGGPIIIHRMSADGRTLLDEGRTVYEGPVAEGTKMFKKDGYYYLSIPEGGVSTGWQTVLRSKSVYGPYDDKKIVLEQGSTDVNGPHQGALVDTPDGQWWFYHFQSTEPLGRVVHLQPVMWKDGFPQIGADYDHNGTGEPVKTFAKPDTRAGGRPQAPQASDSFDGAAIGLQWQFNHNPRHELLSLAERKGWLAIKPAGAAKLREAVNQLTQKTMGYHGVATVKIDFSRMDEGSRAGLECIGGKFVGGGVAVTRREGRVVRSLYVETDGAVSLLGDVPDTAGCCIYIRLEIDAVGNTHRYSYSTDNINYTPLGAAFSSSSGDWKGSRVGIYAYTTAGDGGTTYFDDFKYIYDGPGGLSVHDTE